MTDIKNLTKNALKDIKLIIFDVDGVLVQRGTRISQRGSIVTLEIKHIAKKHIEQIKKMHDKGFLININSGRGLYMLQEMFRNVLDFVSLTYENGSATWNKGQIEQHFNSFLYLKDIQDKLVHVKHKNIKGLEPKEFIITIHCKDRVPQIEKITRKYKHLYCLWNGEAYDIGVKNLQTKGLGVKNVTRLFNLKKKNVLAIGDNYNDKELLEQAGIAVSADKKRLKGDYYVQLHGLHLPADILMEQILKMKK